MLAGSWVASLGGGRIAKSFGWAKSPSASSPLHPPLSFFPSLLFSSFLFASLLLSSLFSSSLCSSLLCSALLFSSLLFSALFFSSPLSHTPMGAYSAPQTLYLYLRGLCLRGRGKVRERGGQRKRKRNEGEKRERSEEGPMKSVKSRTRKVATARPW